MRLFPQGSSLDLLPDAFCFLDVGLLQYLAILALGIVYWLVRDQDRREAEAAALESTETRPP